MDSDRFDRLVRALPADSSRRGLLAVLTGMLLAAMPFGLGLDEAEGKKKRKRKNKDKKRKSKEISPPPSPPGAPPPPPCAPDCTGKSCGDDGCGGSCGGCVGAESCQDGTCRCPDGQPACGVAGICCAADRFCLGLGGGGTCVCSGVGINCGDSCCDPETQRCDGSTCVACAGIGDACFNAASCCQPQPNSRACVDNPVTSEGKVCCGVSGATCTLGQGEACCSGLCTEGGGFPGGPGRCP